MNRVEELERRLKEKEQELEKAREAYNELRLQHHRDGAIWALEGRFNELHRWDCSRVNWVRIVGYFEAGVEGIEAAVDKDEMDRVLEEALESIGEVEEGRVVSDEISEELSERIRLEVFEFLLWQEYEWFYYQTGMDWDIFEYLFRDHFWNFYHMDRFRFSYLGYFDGVVIIANFHAAISGGSISDSLWSEVVAGIVFSTSSYRPLRVFFNGRLMSLTEAYYEYQLLNRCDILIIREKFINYHTWR
ncbi:MAG: hypothetical protein FWE03_05580 [Firmicutes bacterium]|nr:hypothetical protein [Bacillota bacterium]